MIVTSKLFNVIRMVVLTGTTLSTLSAANTAATVRAAAADFSPCSDPAARDVIQFSTLLGQQPGRSQTDCVSACFRHQLCTAVAHVQNDDVTSSCYLLGGISRTPVVLPQAAKCTVLILNPCPVGIAVTRGMCQCPKDSTGQFCETPNPPECYNTWTKVYQSNGTGDLDLVVNSNKRTTGGYLKGGLHSSDGSVLVLDGKFLFSDIASSFASQMIRTLSRKSWDNFDDVPVTEFRLVRSAGTMQSFTDSDGTVSNSQFPLVDWFVRQPHVTNILYHYNSNGDALSGTTLADLVSAVQRGQAIVTYNTVHVNPGADVVHLARYHYEISRAPGTYNFQSSNYWINFKYSTDGTATQHKFNIVSDSFKTALTDIRGRELHLDPCWRAATDTTTLTTTTTATTNNNAITTTTTGQLIAALLNGHTARVMVDDVAVTLNQALVAGDVVMFGALQYLDPTGPGSFSQNTMVLDLVVTTGGEVFTCQTLPNAGTPVFNATVTGIVTWFVDTRQRSRVYSVTSQGEVRAGQESELYSAVAKGATVHLGIVLSDSNHYLLMPVAVVELTPKGHVVAQVEGLSRLPYITDQATPLPNCGQRAFLVTSLGTVRVYDYSHGLPGTHSNLTHVTVDWFVDSYAEN